jgi:hypothetical protein
LNKYRATAAAAAEERKEGWGCRNKYNNSTHRLTSLRWLFDALNSVASSLATFLELNKGGVGGPGDNQDQKKQQEERERENRTQFIQRRRPKAPMLRSDGWRWEKENADALDSVLRAARSFEIRLIAE